MKVTSGGAIFSPNSNFLILTHVETVVIAAEFDFDDLPTISAEQLKEFDVKAGTRKKILKHFEVPPRISFV